MLHLSPSNYSLCRLYCFRDPKLERQYQANVTERNVFYTRLHYLAALAYRIKNCATYQLEATMPVSFWLYFIAAVASVLFVLSGVLNPICRRNSALFHFLYCTLSVGILIALIFVQYVEWFSGWQQSFLPIGGHVLSAPPDGPSVVIDGALDAFLRVLAVRAVVSSATANAAGVLFFVCLTGLNPYSIVFYTLCLGGLIAADTVVMHGILTPLYDIGTLLTLVTSFLLITVVLEGIQRRKFFAEAQLERQMRASETADNILNHMLKNTLADVAGYIELHLQGSVPVSALHDSLACLRRGMRACKERLVYLKLVAGDYTPVLNAVNLADFGRHLAAGRSLTTEFPNTSMLMDHVLCGLILENALSNAAKHGRPENPDVTFAIRLVPDPQAGLGTFEFEVTNLVNPEAPPLTTEYVERLFGGGDGLGGSGERHRRAVFLSDGIGLEHSLLAARLAGITLSLTQHGDRAVFRARVDAAILGTSRPSSLTLPPTISFPSPPSSSVDLRQAGFSDLSTLTFPPKMRFLILDDNAVSRRILSHQITSLCPRAGVTELGDQESDVELFPAMAVEAADVVVVDQHLDYQEPHLGTDVVRRLRQMGYKGLICIRSSDDSPEDQVRYAASGAHCSIGKDVPGPEMAARLIAAYEELHSRTGPPPDAT